jgi:hypothetical protein
MIQPSDTSTLVSGGAILSATAVAMSCVVEKVGPLRLVSRVLDHARALSYMSADMLQAAWGRRDRYSWHLRRARLQR